MKRFMSVLAVLLAFTCTFTVTEVHAKKFGSGRSFGRTVKTAPAPPSVLRAPASNQTQNTANQNRATQNQTAHNQSTMNNSTPQRRGLFGGAMGGFLGGMLAGSLLGSLLGGGAFAGIGLMDILIFGGIAFLVVRLLKSMGRPQSRSQNSHYQTASANSQWQAKTDNTRDATFAEQGSHSTTNTGRIFEAQFGDGYKTDFRQDTHSTQSTTQHQGFGQTNSDVPFNLAPDFDLKGFLNRARNHYRTIQDTWNSGDMNTIRDYVSPDLFEHLAQERAGLKGDQHTEVMYVDAELVRADYNHGCAEVSLQFSGRYRDNVERIEEKITDIWHLEQSQPGAPWLIVGIEYANS